MGEPLINTGLFLAVVAGLGVFFIFLGFTYKKPEKTKTDLENMMSLLDTEELAYKQGGFWKTARKFGLEVALKQADLNVSRSVFIRDGMIFMVAAMAIGYVVGGNITVSIFLGAASWAAYIYWLYERRDKKRIEYEDAIADMSERMASGAELTGTLQGMIAHSCTLAPDILYDDFNEINQLLSSGATFEEATKNVKEKRNSSMLNLLLDTLEMWSKQGTTIPLVEVLNPLTVTIRSRMRARTKMNTELNQQKNTLLIIVFAPLAYMLIMRVAFAGAAEAYKTPIGTLLVFISLAISCIGFLIGQKILSSTSKVFEIEK